MDYLKILNLNAYRMVDCTKIKSILAMIKINLPLVVTIQEIHIANALRVFSPNYQVIVNIEQASRDGIGMCTLISKQVQVKDKVIGANGRIIGVKLDNVQIWNIYPKSGSQHKNIREIFFRQDLPNSLKVWNSCNKSDIIVIGDYNCLHREKDAINNPQVQPGLIKFMKDFKLKDDYVQVHGINANDFSRVTKTSRTRIDTGISNSRCITFEYVPYLGLDHKMIKCEYLIPVKRKRDKIPNEKFISGWVINRDLLKDEIFMDVIKEVLSNINNNKPPDQIWFDFKKILIQWAKQRSRYLKKEQNMYYQRILDHLNLVMEDMKIGYDCKDELCDVIKVLNEFYSMKVNLAIERDMYSEIIDNNEEIIKQENKSKYLGGAIDKIRINNNVYEDKFQIINEIEKEMRKELESDPGKGFSDPLDQEEKYFLNMLPKLELSDEENEKLTGKVNEEEINFILGHDVDLDSSPGLDGITYRCLKVLWEFSKFREIYINYLNWIKEYGEYGMNKNVSVMVLKNKKQNSIDYSQKRKLTKMNKEINLLGKIWSNRCRDILLPKIIHKNQYVCRVDSNIIDELVQLRDLNLFLLGKNGVQNDGSILSLDYQDAFRSVKHRWFNLVLEHIGVPSEFIKFFWNLYKDLGIIISVNRIGSNIIYNRRGFAEGSAPSMAAFVLSTLSLLRGLEDQLEGIRLPDNRLFKVFAFADDQKIALKQPGEIIKVQEIVHRYEKVSGLKLHRDVARKKCNILSFGKHKKVRLWPTFVNQVNKTKIIGAFFLNEGNLEIENSIYARNKCLDKIKANWGLKGTLLQKVYFVNTFCLTKLNYISQAFKMDTKHLEEIKKLSLKFIYAGENERPTSNVNYRKISEGGIGLVEAELKSKSLLYKSVLKEIRERNIVLKSNELDGDIYGADEVIIQFIKEGKMNLTSKEIYDKLVYNLLRRNTSLIPSRIEKKVSNVKWSNSYHNYKYLSEVDPREKELLFRVIQDLVPVAARLHQKSDKRCLRLLHNNTICVQTADKEHFLQQCDSMNEVTTKVKAIRHKILQNKNLTHRDLLFFSFKGRSKNKGKVFSWFLIKVYKKVFYDKLTEVTKIWAEILKDLDFAERNKFKLTEVKEFGLLKEMVLKLQ